MELAVEAEAMAAELPPALAGAVEPSLTPGGPSGAAALLGLELSLAAVNGTARRRQPEER